jgi:hypothetical protein
MFYYTKDFWSAIALNHKSEHLEELGYIQITKQMYIIIEKELLS